MGHIDRFNLQDYIDNYDTSVFVETGTGMGVSLKHALQFPFAEFHTIEIMEELYNKVKEELKENTTCNFVNNNSKDGLKEILSSVDADKNITYWLDAHFPGADFGLAGTSYGSTSDKDVRIPLESELRMIKEIRDTKNDVFVIDDLRIYEDGPFTGGNWSQRRQLGGDGIGFINELFEETHEIHKDFRDQGYIVLLPKK